MSQGIIFQGIMFQGIMSQGIMSQGIVSLGVTYETVPSEGILSQVDIFHSFSTLFTLALPFLPLLSALIILIYPLPSSMSLALGPCHLYPDLNSCCPITSARSPLSLHPLYPNPPGPQPLQIFPSSFSTTSAIKPFTVSI